MNDTLSKEDYMAIVTNVTLAAKASFENNGAPTVIDGCAQIVCTKYKVSMCVGFAPDDVVCSVTILDYYNPRIKSPMNHAFAVACVRLIEKTRDVTQSFLQDEPVQAAIQF